MNPYTTPCDTGIGVYDRSLLYRVLRFLLIVLLAISVVSSLMIWNHRRMIWNRQEQYTSPMEQMREVFLDDWFNDFKS
jgi:hypothetical protein